MEKPAIAPTNTANGKKFNFLASKNIVKIDLIFLPFNFKLVFGLTKVNEIIKPKMSKNKPTIKGNIIFIVVKNGRAIIKNILSNETLPLILPNNFEYSLTLPKPSKVSWKKAEVVPDEKANDTLKKVEPKTKP